jgi:hypothetical protein
MSALGQKQTFSEVCAMSALPPKADIAERPSDVRLCQKRTSAHLLNHLIGPSKQCRRHIKIERLGRLEIDH